MPHDECPMAIALKENRAVRGAEAILERPDGTRIPFTPYPTPLRDASGKLIGAVNMLVDISERQEANDARAYLAAIIESSDDAIVSKTSRASSRAGTGQPRRSSDTQPRRWSASRLPGCSRLTACWKRT